MALLTSTLERLNIVPDASSLMVLGCIVSLYAVFFITKLAAWLTQSRRGSTPPHAAVPLPGKMFKTTPFQAEWSCGEAEPLVAHSQEVAFLVATPTIPPAPWCCEEDDFALDESFEFFTLKQGDGDALWQEDECKPLDDFELSSGLADLWSYTGEFLGGPEAAVAADANSVLETALASGDAKLADAALSAGVRLCSSTWLVRACGQIQEAGIPLMPERSLDLMRVYGHERRADLAVDLWEAHCVELGLDPEDGDASEAPPAAELYGAALEACARANDFETAARAASSTGWRVPLCRHGQAAFLALARWYARRQDVGHAIICYQAVRAVTGSTDLATHRSILVASVRSADMAKADALFEDLISTNNIPDATAFSAMICGHCSAGNIDKATHYFRLLQESGIVPTAPLFDAILDGCAWMNMPALVEQVLADMEATGVPPSTTTLSILMRLHGLNRETEEALALFEELPRKHGLKLDGHAYGTLISVCLKNDVYDMAWNAFERMSADGCMAHARIYERLIAACLRRGLLDHAVHVVYDALGITQQQETMKDEPVVTPRLRLQAKTIEDVLTLIGRRRQAARLGAPMVERLQAAGVEISESLVDSVLQSASASSEFPSSLLHQRRSQLQEWRNFSETVCAR